MAILILEQDGQRSGAVLNGRVVIGRRANNHIRIPDRSVSRIHAWIGHAGGYFVADTGSRTGTIVNGERMRGRRALHDGDRIGIGPAQLIFGTANVLPDDCAPLDISDKGLADDEGLFVDCACGAPIWAPWDFGGKTGRCRDCGSLIQLPLPPDDVDRKKDSSDTIYPGMPAPARRQPGGVRLAPDTFSTTPPAPRGAQQLLDAGQPRPAADDQAEKAAATETLCGACQSSISMLEETTTCPECGVAFHAECWIENRGCSSYGCKQVGILNPPADPVTAAAAEPSPAVTGEVTAPEKQELHDAASDPQKAVAWEYLLLPLSVVLGLAGAFAFGAPSVLMVIGLALYSIRRTPRDRTLHGVAMIVSVVAAAAGSAFSTYWWLGGPSRMPHL